MPDKNVNKITKKVEFEIFFILIVSESLGNSIGINIIVTLFHGYIHVDFFL